MPKCDQVARWVIHLTGREPPKPQNTTVGHVQSSRHGHYQLHIVKSHPWLMLSELLSLCVCVVAILRPLYVSNVFFLYPSTHCPEEDADTRGCNSSRVKIFLTLVTPSSLLAQWDPKTPEIADHSAWYSPSQSIQYQNKVIHTLPSSATPTTLHHVLINLHNVFL